MDSGDGGAVSAVRQAAPDPEVSARRLHAPATIGAVMLTEVRGRWLAELLNLPGCAAMGDTPLDARRNVLDLAARLLGPETT